MAGKRGRMPGAAALQQMACLPRCAVGDAQSSAGFFKKPALFFKEGSAISTHDKPVRVDIISGFLGAGKTTFLLGMLSKAPREVRIAVIENEFGKVSVDANALQGTSVKVTELLAGCICCSLSGSFVQAVLQILDAQKPDRLIIEPTGLAQLSDVLSALREPQLEGRIAPGARILVVDGPGFSGTLERMPKWQEDQIAAADAVFVSKQHRMTPLQLGALEADIASLGAKAAVYTTPWEALDLWRITDMLPALGQAAEEAVRSEVKGQPGALHMTARDIKRLTVPGGSPGTLERMTSLLSAMPEGVLRVKGYAVDAAGDCFTLDYVPGQLYQKTCLPPADIALQWIGIDLPQALLVQPKPMPGARRVARRRAATGES